MAIDAVNPASPPGIDPSSNADAQNMGVSEVDFLKIFMEELSYQDPLNPVDNKEFMAQLAQFSTLQEARTTNQKLDNLLTLNAESLAMSLIGKYVALANDEAHFGTVSEVDFVNGVPKLKANINGELQEVDLSQVAAVRNNT